MVHGPKPRKYDQRTPKKMKAAALRGALTDRANDGRLKVVTSFVSGDVPSTKSAKQTLQALAVDGAVLAVVAREEDVSWLSLRNIPTVNIVAPDQLNTYDVLVSDYLVFTATALTEFVSESGAPVGRKVAAPASDAKNESKESEGAS